MVSGTSDGSDFGGAGSGGDGPTRFRFSRFDLSHQDRNIEAVVGPHGRNGGLRKEIERASRQSGLEPQFVWADDPGDERFDHSILSTDPWNGNDTRVRPGYYARATGNTTYGAVCWKLPRRRGGHLEISYVTWNYYETGDFASSVVAKVVPPLQATIPELAELKRAATNVTAKIAAWLKAAPPSPASLLLRKSLVP